MLSTTFMPMRKTIGPTIPKFNLEEVGRSPEANGINLIIKQHTDLSALLHQPEYADFLPQDAHMDNELWSPADNTDTLAIPADIPSGDTIQFAYSLFGIGPKVDDNISRSLWIDIVIHGLGNAPIGGICYGGYPYLPYYLTPQGENSANFGLPRELRLSWDSQQNRGFIDAENAITHQEPVSHSGVHIFSTGQIRTDKLILRISDFPKIIKKVHRTATGQSEIEEYWGFIIPYFYVFRHQEGTRYSPKVPAGLLGAIQVPSKVNRSFFQPTIDPLTGQVLEPYTKAYVDYLLQTENPRLRYFHLSGASMFGQQRTFSVILQPGNVQRELKERFVSQELQKGDELRMFIEQGEEYPRCIAGIKLHLTTEGTISNALPPLPPRLPYTKVKIYEFDPAAGVSPLAFGTEADIDKYANCLFEGTMGNDVSFLGRFVRSSSMRYFVIVFKNESNSLGHVHIDTLELVQSAHVTVAPRPSRNQVIRALHFRLIGPELANDYAQLGRADFSLTVEHLVANQKKDVLFEANSLLDLLQSGKVRLYSNHRRHMIEKEVTETLDGSYSQQMSAVRANGWNRSESGDGVTDDPSWTNSQTKPDGQYGFTVLGNRETRTHTRHLGKIDEVYLALLDDILEPTIDIDSGDDALWQTSNRNVRKWAPWRGVGSNALAIDGLWNINIPPYFKSLWEAWQPSQAQLTNPSPTMLNDLFDSFIQTKMAQLLLINGFSVGISPGANVGLGISPFSGGVSVGASLSASVGIPTLLESNTIGTTGTIVQQANKTGYSYAQHLNNRFDETQARTDFAAGSTMKREVTRFPVENSTGGIMRTNGAEIMWQGQLMDIVTGTISLSIALSATAGKMYRTTDDSLRVRFGNGLGESVRVDVWFDIVEEVIRDDH